MKTRNEQFLLLRSFDAELSAGDRRRLEALLAASETARTARDQFESIRHSIQDYGPARFADGFASRVMDAILEPAASPVEGFAAPMARIYSLHAGRILRAAAVILLLVAVSAVIWMQPRSYTVPHGKLITRMLPDGSTVQLSSGSTLSYKPFWGRPARLVRLEGEAFFDVTGTDKPFVVETFNARIEVLGTRFNVKAWPEYTDRQTTVTLEEGRVEVAARERPEDVIELKPEHTAIVRGDTTLPARPVTRPVASLLAWRNGGFAFEDETLASVAAEIERRYAIQITINEELAEKRIGYFLPQAQPLTNVLTDITGAYELAYRPTANGYEIFKP